MAKQDFSAKVGSCSVSMGLDRRKKYADGYRLAMKYVINQKILYYPLSWRADDSDFNRIVETSTTRGRMSETRKTDAKINEEWKTTFISYKERLEALARTTTLTLDVIKIDLEGRSDSTNFIQVWREVIASKNYGTAQSYEIALKSFMKGFSEDDGFSVTKEAIHEWVQRMTDEGKSKATIGIYLRSCRVIVNECIRRGYMQQRNYPFSEKRSDLVSIPKGKNRQEDSLSVEQWTQLYNIFISKDYPDGWDKDYRENVNTSLGLFIFMYLGNGMNLADLARLTYNDYYIRSHKKSLMFHRQKTKDRTDNDSEVIIPITEPLKAILGELAADYEPDGRLFPFILKEATTDKETARRVQQENQNVKKHIRKLTNSLGWTEQPSPTWCRHSFASNLIHQEVPREYVSEAMGHSVAKSVTMGYVSRFPHEIQMQYNSKLLNLQNDDSKLSDIIGNLSNEEKDKLLALLLKKDKEA